MYCIFYFVYGLSDFMQLLDSAFTAHISTQDLLLEHCIFYFVYGLSDFMQLVDSTLTACMQCTGFTT